MRPALTKRHYRKYDIIPVFTDIAQSAVKEKVIRVVIATFRVSSRLYIAFCKFCHPTHQGPRTESRFEGTSAKPVSYVCRQATSLHSESLYP